MTRARASEAGFTLIELLVALSVFAIAALALLRLNGFALMTTADLDGRALAQLVVRNAAVLAATDTGPILLGTTTRVTPTDDARLVQIDLLAVAQDSSARAVTTVIKRVG
jgi:general secretion pathway protein I